MNTKEKELIQSLTQTMDFWCFSSKANFSGIPKAERLDTQHYKIHVILAGAGYEGRTPRIEAYTAGTPVVVIREPENRYSELNFGVYSPSGETLGNMPGTFCESIAPLVDAGIVRIESAIAEEILTRAQRGAKARNPEMTVSLTLTVLTDLIAAETLPEETYSPKDQCIVCRLGGDQTKCWTQELVIRRCSIPLAHAWLLFEVYNRMHGEYEAAEDGSSNLRYLGLDNLEAEVIAAREQMNTSRNPSFSYVRGYDPDDENAPDNFADYLTKVISDEPSRYGCLKPYLEKALKTKDRNWLDLEALFEAFAEDMHNFYWVDQTRMTESEWRDEGGSRNHWYEVMELYNPSEPLPFDLSDQDIVSIFGFNKFSAFADLSYGC